MTVERKKVSPAQATMWLASSMEETTIERVKPFFDKVGEGRLEPSPPITIKDGWVTNGSHRLFAISMFHNVQGFQPVELDVDFVTSDSESD